MIFTKAELGYLASQRLGRLATDDAEGNVQNNPTSFFSTEETGTIDIGGLAMGSTKKFRNVQAHPRVSVVDDVASSRARAA